MQDGLTFYGVLCLMILTLEMEVIIWLKFCFINLFAKVNKKKELDLVYTGDQSFFVHL